MPRAGVMMCPSRDSMAVMIKCNSDSSSIFDMTTTLQQAFQNTTTYKMWLRHKQPPMPVPPPPRMKHASTDKISCPDLKHLQASGMQTQATTFPQQPLMSRFSDDTIRQKPFRKRHPRNVNKPLPPTPPSAALGESHEMARKPAQRRFRSISSEDLRLTCGVSTHPIAGVRHMKAIPEYEDLRPCAGAYYIGNRHEIARNGEDPFLFHSHEKCQAQAEAEAKALDVILSSPEVETEPSNKVEWKAKGLLKPKPDVQPAIPSGKKKQVRWNHIPNIWHTPEDEPVATLKGPATAPAPKDLEVDDRSFKRSMFSKKSQSALRDSDETVDGGFLSKPSSRVKALSPFLGGHSNQMPLSADKGSESEEEQTLVAVETLLDARAHNIDFEAMRPLSAEREREMAQLRSATFIKDSEFAQYTKARAEEARDGTNSKTIESFVESQFQRDQHSNDKAHAATDKVVIGKTRMNFIPRSEFTRRVAARLKACRKRLSVREITDEAQKMVREAVKDKDATSSIFMDKLLADLQAQSSNSSPRTDHQPANFKTGDFAEQLRRVPTGCPSMSPPSSAELSAASTTPSILSSKSSPPQDSVLDDPSPRDAQFERERMQLLDALNTARRKKNLSTNQTTEKLESARRGVLRFSEDMQIEMLQIDPDLDADAQIAADGQDLLSATACAKTEYNHASDERDLLTANLWRRQRDNASSSSSINFISETGHVQIIGPANHGAIATGVSWTDGEHLLHAKDKFNRSIHPANRNDEPCLCDHHAIYNAITDASYNYVGIARSRLEGRWILHLAKERPSEEKSARLQAIRRFQESLRQSLHLEEAADLLAAEYQEECLSDEEDDEEQARIEALRRQFSVKIPLPSKSCPALRRPVDEPEIEVEDAMVESGKKLGTRTMCDSVHAGRMCSYAIPLDGKSLEGGFF